MGATTGDTALENRSPLRELIASDVPCVAASFTDEASNSAIEDAASAGLDVAELRIDHFSSIDPDHVATTARRFAALPTIATIRSTAEGGGWTGSDAERLALYETVTPLVDAVDIELSSNAIVKPVVAIAHDDDAIAIVSFHDFAGTPPVADLLDLVSTAKALGADLVKLAVLVESTDDLRALAAFTLDHRDLGLIVIGMGPAGAASRVFFPFLGSRLTFASAVHTTAPGQLALSDTVRILAQCSPAFQERHRLDRLGPAQ